MDGIPSCVRRKSSNKHGMHALVHAQAHIFVGRIDHFRKLTALVHFLKYPHANFFIKLREIAMSIAAGSSHGARSPSHPTRATPAWLRNCTPKVHTLSKRNTFCPRIVATALPLQKQRRQQRQWLQKPTV